MHKRGTNSAYHSWIKRMIDLVIYTHCKGAPMRKDEGRFAKLSWHVEETSKHEAPVGLFIQPVVDCFAFVKMTGSLV